MKPDRRKGGAAESRGPDLSGGLLPGVETETWTTEPRRAHLQSPAELPRPTHTAAAFLSVETRMSRLYGHLPPPRAVPTRAGDGSSTKQQGRSQLLRNGVLGRSVLLAKGMLCSPPPTCRVNPRRAAMLRNCGIVQPCSLDSCHFTGSPASRGKHHGHRQIRINIITNGKPKTLV